MGLFTKRTEEPPIVDNRTTTTAEPRRSSTLFSSRRHGSEPVNTTANTSRTSTSHFNHRSRSRSNSRSPHRRGGLLHRMNGTDSGDPSIRAAHERVLTAEAAEREADKALAHAKNMVRDARLEVKRLEKEAAEDARLAKLKQREAASISRRAGKLGGL